MMKKGRLYLFQVKILFLLLGLIALRPGGVRAQDSTVVLDGTQGELFRSKGADSLQQQSQLRWNEFENPFSTLKLGGGFLYEYATYAQDEASEKQVTLEPDFKVRDFRATLSGRIKTERDITWKMGIMYDGSTKTWFMRETGVMVKLKEIEGYVFVGRTKEGYSMSKVMNGYSIFNMERYMAIDIIPILADGFKYIGYLPKEKLVINAGIYTDWLSEGQSFSTYAWQTAARVAWLPVYHDMQGSVLHVGVNLRYGEVKDGKIQVRSRPEANPAPYFIDTKVFSANTTTSVGGELYYRPGRFLFGAEWNAHRMDSPDNDNPVFIGGEAFVSYSLTGEVRHYLTVPGIFGFVKVKHPVFKGGPGAWDVVLRYSSLDLDDGKIHGGTFWRFTPTVNWYLSDNVHMFFAYGYGVLDRFDLEGTTHFFQTRILFML